MIKKVIISISLICASQIYAGESAAQCMKGRIVRTMNYTVAPLQTLHISGVVFGPSISVWSLGFVKGSTDTGIICYVNGRPDGWNDNWVSYNMGPQHLKLIPMFPNEASFYGQASGGLTGSNVTMVGTCIPDGASFAVFMATPGKRIKSAIEIIKENPEVKELTSDIMEVINTSAENKEKSINDVEEEKQNIVKETQNLQIEESKVESNINLETNKYNETPEEIKEGLNKEEQRFDEERKENELLEFQHGIYDPENKFNSELIGDNKITKELYAQAQEVLKEMKLNNPESEIHITFFDPKNKEPSKASDILNNNFKEFMLKQLHKDISKPEFKLANSPTAPNDPEASNVYNNDSNATPPTEKVATETSNTSISSGKHDSGSYRLFIKIPRVGLKQIKWSSSKAPRQPASGHKRIDPLPGTPSRRSVGRRENPTKKSNPEKNEKFEDKVKYRKYANVEKYKYQLLRSIEEYEPYEVNDIVAVRDNLKMRKGWNFPDNWFMDWYDDKEWNKRKTQRSQKKIPSSIYLSQAQKSAEYIKHEIIYLENYGKIIYPTSMILAQNILAPNSKYFYLMEENIVLTIFYKKLYENTSSSSSSGSSSSWGRGGRNKKWSSGNSNSKLKEKYKRLYLEHQRVALYYLSNNNKTKIDSVKEQFPLAELEEYEYILKNTTINKVGKNK